MKTKAAWLLLPLLAAGCIYIDEPAAQPGSDAPAHGRTQPHHPYPADSQSTARTHPIRTADGKCLDRSRSQYKGMIAYACHGGRNQQFAFSNNRIVVEGLCLDVAAAQSADGTPVIAYPCHNNKNQQWYRDGRTIRSALNGKCLDAGKHGNQIRMYRCDGSNGQRFDISRY